MRIHKDKATYATSTANQHPSTFHFPELGDSETFEPVPYTKRSLFSCKSSWSWLPVINKDHKYLANIYIPDKIETLEQLEQTHSQGVGQAS